MRSNNSRQTLYCRYYDTKRGTRVYDFSTMWHTKKGVKERELDRISHLSADAQAKIIKELTIEKVSVIIRQFRELKSRPRNLESQVGFYLPGGAHVLCSKAPDTKTLEAIGTMVELAKKNCK